MAQNMQNKNNVNPIADESDQAAFIVADIKDDRGIYDIYVSPTLFHVGKVRPRSSFYDPAPADQGRFPLRMLLVRLAKLPLSDDAHCANLRILRRLASRDSSQIAKAFVRCRAEGPGATFKPKDANPE